MITIPCDHLLAPDDLFGSFGVLLQHHSGHLVGSLFDAADFGKCRAALVIMGIIGFAQRCAKLFRTSSPTDGDAFSNLQEYQRGGDPNDPLSPATSPEDIDGTNTVDAVDVQLVINAALSINTGYNCDVDGSGNVDAVDVQLVINAALGLI
ncbi:MAG: hypothetical protein HY706_11570 [Candidatus Hydrogenedentes bacterium]|nr:hypothetical protein [Candidatus Hydrogenedentota bacterium]